jgi:hypothetical protein
MDQIVEMNLVVLQPCGGYGKNMEESANMVRNLISQY